LRLFFYIRIVLNRLILRRGANKLIWRDQGALKGIWFNVIGLLIPSVVFFTMLNFKLFKTVSLQSSKNVY
jgi:hypothetical protein